MADVTADLNAEVATDSAGGGVSGVGGTEEGTARLDDVKALPAHGNDGAGREVVAETLVELLVLEVNVVLSSLLEGRGEELEANELEALGLETLHDLTNKATLDTIGLDGNESALGLGAGNTDDGRLLLGSRH